MIVAVICILFLSVFIAFSPVEICRVSGEKIRVDYIDGKNYTSIQAAINNASDGDTIYVHSGIYYENVIIDKSIMLAGENKNTTIIDGGGSSSVVKIVVDHVNISGFTIQNSGSELGDAGISVGSNYNTISENNIINNNYHGIYLLYSPYWGDEDHIVVHSSENNMISRNTVAENKKSGIFIVEGYNSTITCNTLANNTNDGISLTYSFNNIISENKITNSKIAVSLEEKSSGNTIIQNNIINSNYGIKLSRSFNNIVNGNAIKNSEYGIYLLSSSDELISENVITEINTVGIDLEICHHITIKENTIGNSSIGIYVSIDSYDNQVSDNTFFNNNVDFGGKSLSPFEPWSLPFLILFAALYIIFIFVISYLIKKHKYRLIWGFLALITALSLYIIGGFMLVRHYNALLTFAGGIGVLCGISFFIMGIILLIVFGFLIKNEKE